MTPRDPGSCGISVLNERVGRKILTIRQTRYLCPSRCARQLLRTIPEI